MVLVVLLLLLCWILPVGALDYPVIFLSSPRLGGNEARSRLPDVHHPLWYEPGTSLLYLAPGASTPTTLVDAGVGAVLDPVMSYDGKAVYYSAIPDMSSTGVNAQRGDLPRGGCDLFRLDLATRRVTKLLGQDAWRPSRSITTWSQRPDSAQPPGTSFLGYGICHSGAVPLPNGDLWFTSNLLGNDKIKGFAVPSTQGFVLHADTGFIDQVWHSPSIILHPTIVSSSGEIVFATSELEFFGKPHRWALWAVLPDGRTWRPILSATMDHEGSRHMHTEYRDAIVATSYYQTNNGGLGTLLARPLFFSSTPSAPEFGSPIARSNPQIPMWNRPFRFAYTPAGLTNVTPMAHHYDEASHELDGVRQGKFGFPSAAPNGILVSYSGGPANYHERPISKPSPQLGIYLIPDGQQLEGLAELQLVYNDPTRNAFMAKAVVPYKAIYGVDTPKAQPTYPPNDGTRHAVLPAGTPYGLIGTSSLYHRESCGGQFFPTWECASPPYTGPNPGHSNRLWQGADTHKFSNEAIHAIQILLQSGVSHLSYGPGSQGDSTTQTFDALGGNERLSILADIPVRKKDAQGQVLKDAHGNPDTSFLAKIPADTSFTFRLVDAQGMVLTHSPTWHQLRPGEIRTDCGGCHAHNKQPLDFATTAAGQPGFVPVDLTQQQPWTREWHRDIEPLVVQHCGACHNATRHEGHLDLLTATPIGKIPRNYLLLTDDRDGKLAGPPPIAPYLGRQSRYVASFAAAESLLAWVVAGKRLDGVDNATRPSVRTEGVPMHRVDLDYTPAVQAAHTGLRLTAQEVRAIIEWIDMGAPRNRDAPRGWMADELRPVIAWHDTPAPTVPGCACPLGGTITIGLHDVGTGLALPTLQVSRDGQPQPVTPLDASRWQVPRAPGLWRVQVADTAGNTQELLRRIP